LCGKPFDTSLRFDPSIHLSALERNVSKIEEKVGLWGVKYDAFEAAITRYGYTGRLTDTTLAEIKDEINLNVDVLSDPLNEIHFYYQADVGFEKGNYETNKILLLGFLMCYQDNP
jgi:hypothetical protein